MPAIFCAVSLAADGAAYPGDIPKGTWPAPLYAVHLEASDGRIHTESVDRDGHTFFEQTVELDADSPRSYAFKNTATGESGTMKVRADTLVLELTHAGKTRTATLPRPKELAVGPSIARLIARHLAELKAGKTVAFDMAVVPRLDCYTLEVSQAPAHDDEPLAEVRAGKWLRLRTQPRSGLARLFAPTVWTIVDATTGATLFVTGPLPSPTPGEGTVKLGTLRYAPVVTRP
jgi:hypothetical protein